MKRTSFVAGLLVLGAIGCNSGASDCVAAGGSCRRICPSGAGMLPHDCNNGQITPGGLSCCAPCPNGTIESPAGACVSVDAGGDANADAGDAAE